MVDGVVQYVDCQVGGQNILVKKKDNQVQLALRIFQIGKIFWTAFNLI